MLATGGNLVFQGRADGIFAAYRATDGQQVWQFDAATGIMAPPGTYSIDGGQFLTVMAGWGGDRNAAGGGSERRTPRQTIALKALFAVGDPNATPESAAS